MSALPEHHNAAIRQSQEAVARAPHDADAWHQLGWAYEQYDDVEEASRCYRRAVQINPRADGSFNNLANCLNSLGRFDEAYEAWRTAIELAPACTTYYRNLVQSKTLRADDPCFVLLEKQIEHAASLSREDQAELFFAYGQALQGIGEPERAFERIVQANTLHRFAVKYDEAVTLGLFGQLPQLFTQDLLRAKAGAGDPSTSPVFVIGMPRSGSSLIEQILASYPQVFGAGERTEFGEVLAQAFTRGVPDGSATIGLEALHETSAVQLHALGAEYRQRIGRTVQGGPYECIVDKYLYNFIHAGFIHLALPNARFIHIRRAPVDNCLSIYSRRFRDVPFGYDLGELGRYYRAYDALMAHWREVMPEGVLLEIRYEDLVADLEGGVRRMLAHCGLEWDERCLAFHQTRRQVTTASAWQVRQPLYRTSVRRWRPDASVLRPLLDGLGPDLVDEADLCSSE